MGYQQLQKREDVVCAPRKVCSGLDVGETVPALLGLQKCFFPLPAQVALEYGRTRLSTALNKNFSEDTGERPLPRHPGPEPANVIRRGAPLSQGLGPNAKLGL